MKLVIQGKNIEITDALHEYVRQKVEKAVSHFQNLTTEVDVCLSVARNPRINPRQTAEVTIYANGAVVRAEESSENLYASIDLVADKISRQLRKFKEKRKTHTPIRTAEVLPYQPVDADLLANREPELPSEVVRSKYFAMPPMTIEQALEQLELVDHDFYMFLNAETGEINVIYERNHGGYGVIQPRRTNGHHPAENGNGKAAQNGTKAYTPSTTASVHKGT
ncbi:ribosome-associated translation inhibitor RaiA [Thermoleptolyngbya sichuanensis A183]|uniref:Ribosome hibernation promoting factor n=1 Tax=Thermoleptolyngbya sichuanensis A183 TaxID=2737172 RepID=A0A6M8B761_9CYAN|nr:MULTISPECIES: ribosome-associated translation inhibitor RaiA [Thermoleptolyngbya]QKD82308.1 ribosome-associated translation inhibitor RaiA [Thermoleptolyngbya sichuanensis A183]